MFDVQALLGAADLVQPGLQRGQFPGRGAKQAEEEGPSLPLWVFHRVTCRLVELSWGDREYRTGALLRSPK